MSTMDNVICQLCSKPFSDPRMLPCLHSFCCQCLQHEMEKVGPQPSIQCPNCLRTAPIPVEGANALPQNVHLAFEVEVAGYMSKIVSACSVPCTFCVNGCHNHAVTFCCACHMFLCKDGQDSHQRAPQLSHHCMVGLDKESATLLPTMIKPIDLYCSKPKHKKQELDFYCKSCNNFICRDCFAVTHKGHEITTLPTVAEAHRDQMRGTLQCAQGAVSTLAGAIDANKKTMQQVEISKQEAELVIRNAFEQLMEMLEERKKALLSELEMITVSKTTSLVLQTKQFEKIQQDIGHYTEMTSHILQTHTDHEVVALGGLVPTELKATLKTVENMSLTPNQHSFLKVFIRSEPLINDLSKLGEIVNIPPAPNETRCVFDHVARINTLYHVKVETMSLNGERYPCGGLQVKAELRPKSHDGPVVSGEVEDHRDGTYTIALTPQTTGPHQLHITMDGQHVQKSPYDMRVRGDYTTLCNPQQVISVSAKPYCVAIHTNGDIYIGSIDDHIYVFDQGGHLRNTIGISGSGNGQFNGPVGISIKGDVMYVADHWNHRIQKLTTDGKYLHKFGKEGSGQGEFMGASGVLVDSKDRVIASDRDNSRVQIFNQIGGWLLTLDGDTAYRWPVGLALDSQENIHVAAYGSNTVKVFTPEGTYLRMYGDMVGPMGVDIDEDGYSLVSEGRGNCISIFDPQGHKIHIVGDLRSPQGIAIDTKRGSFYVANCGGSNVLKYTMFKM